MAYEVAHGAYAQLAVEQLGTRLAHAGHEFHVGIENPYPRSREYFSQR